MYVKAYTMLHMYTPQQIIAASVSLYTFIVPKFIYINGDIHSIRGLDASCTNYEVQGNALTTNKRIRVSIQLCSIILIQYKIPLDTCSNIETCGCLFFILFLAAINSLHYILIFSFLMKSNIPIASIA